MWSSPLVVLSLVISLLYAAIFHLIAGGNVRALLASCVASALGMVVGQLASSHLSWQGPTIGELHVVTASVGAWAAMLLVRQARP